jgi:hypothetical protein
LRNKNISAIVSPHHENTINHRRQRMKSRPILFSAQMVRTILDGSKTQTRRVAKLNYSGRVKLPGSSLNWHLGDPNAVLACPYGQPGDQLKIRETWKADQIWDDFKPSQIPKGEPILYAADEHATGIVPFAWGRGRPSIFLPGWASRITLEITGIRVERLQDISEEDAKAEGVLNDEHVTPRIRYQWLWEHINGPGSWDKNPWVWVVTFKRIEGGDK